MQEMQENKGARKEGLRTGWIKERWESGHGMLYTVQVGCKTRGIQDRSYTQKEGFKT